MTQDPGPKTAEQIIRNLHNFNRKERDHLIKFVLSESPGHPQISSDLWRAIRPAGGKRQRPTPSDTFVGMDYHLNWLYAALVLSEQYEDEGIGNQPNRWPVSVQFENKQDAPIQPNQEDVDLLVAFKQPDGSLHLVLIEAKLDSGWDSRQFLSKTARLDAIKRVSDMLNPKLRIEWKLLLASPSPGGPGKRAFSPENLCRLPAWMTEKTDGITTVPHLQFGPRRFYHVKRETGENGSPWEVVKIKLNRQAEN